MKGRWLAFGLCALALGCKGPTEAPAGPPGAAPSSPGDKLASADPKVRLEAVKALSLRPADGVAPLTRLLPGEKDEAVREAALNVLAAAADSRALAGILPLLREKMPPRGVFQALSRIGDPSIAPALGPVLGHPSAALRSEAVEVLGDLRGPGAQDLIARALRDADPGVVREALRSAGRNPSPANVSPVAALASSKDVKIRARAVAALVAMSRGGVALTIAAQAILEAAAKDPEAEVRAAAKVPSPKK